MMPATVNDVSSKVMGYANYFVLLLSFSSKELRVADHVFSYRQYSIVFTNGSVGILYTCSGHQRLSSMHCVQLLSHWRQNDNEHLRQLEAGGERKSHSVDTFGN